MAYSAFSAKFRTWSLKLSLRPLADISPVNGYFLDKNINRELPMAPLSAQSSDFLVAYLNERVQHLHASIRLREGDGYNIKIGMATMT